VNLNVLPHAINDVRSASRQLNGSGRNLGRALKSEFGQALLAIAAMPRLYSPVEDGPANRECREFYMERFKNRVIYLIQDDTIHVLAVFHATRMPGAWRRRLDDAS